MSTVGGGVLSPLFSVTSAHCCGAGGGSPVGGWGAVGGGAQGTYGHRVFDGG